MQRQNVEFNKDNSSYTNSILQALSILPSFYSQDSSQYDKILPLSRAGNLNISFLTRKASPIDLSNFIWASRNKISNDYRSPCSFNNQQDVH